MGSPPEDGRDAPGGGGRMAWNPRRRNLVPAELEHIAAAHVGSELVLPVTRVSG